MYQAQEEKDSEKKMKINTLISLPFSLINCRATSFWNISKLSVSSFMWKSMRKGSPSSVNSCGKKLLMKISGLSIQFSSFQSGTSVDSICVTNSYK